MGNCRRSGSAESDKQVLVSNCEDDGGGQTAGNNEPEVQEGRSKEAVGRWLSVKIASEKPQG